MQSFHGTTIVSVRNTHQVALGGDGQVSIGDTVMKGNAVKVRKLHNDTVMAGFAGSTADAFTLFEKFEAELSKHPGQLARAAALVAGMAPDPQRDAWRTAAEARLLVDSSLANMVVALTGHLARLVTLVEGQ